MQAAPAQAEFTYFDWFLIVVLLVSTVAAFRRGLIAVLFSLGGLIVGILVASWNYLTLANALHRVILNFALAEGIAFVVIAVLVIMLFTVLSQALRRTVKAIGLGFVDRLGGALFGLVRGLLIGVAAMMAVMAFVPQATWLEKSQLAPYFLRGVHAVSFVVPQHFQDQISAGAKYLIHETPELFRPHTLTQPM
jgi:membrane protein required for colicin V production